MRKVVMVMVLVGAGMAAGQVFLNPVASAVTSVVGARSASLADKQAVLHAGVQALMCPPKDRTGAALVDAPNLPEHQRDTYRQAQLSAEEDDDFMTRPHLPSVRGLGRAAWSCLMPGRRCVGGSGLGQQFVRNILARFADPHTARERTLSRKWDEWQLTEELDAMLSAYEPDLTKRRQLLLDLTALVFEAGLERPGSLDAAAHRFFNRPAAALTDKELVALVAAQPRPSYFMDHPDELEMRTRWVLSRMGRNEERDKPLVVKRGRAEPPTFAQLLTRPAALDRAPAKKGSCGEALSLDLGVQAEASTGVQEFSTSPAIQKKYGDALRLAVFIADDRGLAAVATNSLTDVLAQTFPLGSLSKLVMIERCLEAAPELEVPTGDVVLMDQRGSPWSIRNFSPPPAEYATCETIAAASLNAAAARLAVLLPDFMGAKEVQTYTPQVPAETHTRTNVATHAVLREVYGPYYAASPGDLGINERLMVSAAYVKSRTEELVGEGQLATMPLRPSTILGTGELTPPQILAYGHNLFWRRADLHALSIHGADGKAGGPRLSKLGRALASANPDHATYGSLLRAPLRLPAKTGTAGARAALVVFGAVLDGRPATGLAIAWREGERGLDNTEDGSRGLTGGALAPLARDLLIRLGARVRSPA